MNTTAIGSRAAGVRTSAIAQTRVQAIPWATWACFLAPICICTGLYWDISWHETIGRDTFWTPAHLLIQFGAVLAGIASVYMIGRATFGGGSEAKQTSVSVLGLRGPLGAFICGWGGGAMITSAPFDDWWHNAYGLDVKIISPPHVLLALGIAGIMWGSTLLAVAQMNRADEGMRRKFQWLVLVLGGFIVLQDMTLKLEHTNRVFLHSASSYMSISIGLLFMVEAIARVTGHRWARTITTGIYTLFVMLMLWILPLFPAQPKLGPVYQNITHMVPLPFPVLLVVPAFLLDLVWPRLENFSKWQQALLGGVAFLAILIAVEWPFATFLMSSHAHNWFFNNDNFPYFAPPNAPTVRHVFVQAEQTAALFWQKLGIAFVLSVVSLRLGITWGNWMRRVRR
ncbi:MAG TPA: hypothetical protein VLT16_03190 [Candidatus Limnocylindrales bacterium]|nr:hypothetical protein [Candidatus Limnocylindrales bacterium]